MFEGLVLFGNSIVRFGTPEIIGYALLSSLVGVVMGALPGLTAAVTQQTTFACSLVNPFEGMEMGSAVRLKKMTREAPSYLTSCGLALRRFLQ